MSISSADARSVYAVAIRDSDLPEASAIQALSRISLDQARAKAPQWVAHHVVATVDTADSNARLASARVSDELYHFAALFSVLDEMASLPEGVGYAVDAETVEDALRVLNFIEMSDVPAPKVFSHGGDAVVFSWDFPNISRYLTVSGGDAAFLDVNTTTHVQCSYPIVPLEASKAWTKLLGPRSKSIANVGR